MKQLQLQLHLSKEKLMRIKYEHDFKLLHKMCMLKSFYAKNISQKRKRERKSIQYDIRPRKKIHLKKKKIIGLQKTNSTVKSSTYKLLIPKPIYDNQSIPE